jgi:hypothetical protein
MTKTQEEKLPVTPVAAAEADQDPAKIEQPAPTEMVAQHQGDEYRAMSAADERQIAQDLQGRAPKAMLYAFNQGGQQVIGLSWVGVREAIRQVNTRGYGRIHITPEPAPIFDEIEEVDENGETSRAVRCTVYARDDMHGGGNWGTATQPKLMKAKGKLKADPFAATKALSKAQRNAQEPFIPLQLVEELKHVYLGTGEVEYVSGVAKEIERPAPLTDARAQKQEHEIRELYEKIREEHGLALITPARFSGFLTSAQHSHDRMDDLIAHLKDTLKTGKDPTTKKAAAKKTGVRK